MALLSIRDVFKSYFLHGKRIDVLRGVSLDIGKGEMVSLIGASGAGQPGDDRPPDLAGDARDALQVAGAGDGKPGLDHVHAQPGELVGDGL